MMHKDEKEKSLCLTAGSLERRGCETGTFQKRCLGRFFPNSVHAVNAKRENKRCAVPINLRSITFFIKKVGN